MQKEDVGMSQSVQNLLPAALRESLARLGTEYVDAYLLHTPRDSLESVVAAMDGLVASGAARAWGLSNHSLAAVKEASDLAIHVPPAVLQNPYSLLCRDIESNGQLTWAVENGVSQTVYSPLAVGLLTDAYDHGHAVAAGEEGIWRKQGAKKKLLPVLQERYQKVIGCVRAVADERGCTMAQVSLAWLKGVEGISRIIVGVDSEQHLEEALTAIHSLNLSKDETQALDEASAAVLAAVGPLGIDGTDGPEGRDDVYPWQG